MFIILTMLKFALQYISPLYSLTPTSHEPIHSTHTIRRFHQYIISNHIPVNDSRTSNIFTTTTIHNFAVTITINKSQITNLSSLSTHVNPLSRSKRIPWVTAIYVYLKKSLRNIPSLGILGQFFLKIFDGSAYN